MKKLINVLFGLSAILLFHSCASDSEVISEVPEEQEVTPEEENFILESFGNNIDLDNLHNYEDQDIPNYINEDNTDDNDISNEVATLGRVLFYDTNLSSDNSVSCASCHKQELAFGDDRQLSLGVNGETGRHSMRLVNARFAEESRFFWDERARTLEEQTTMPIQDHAEMGFSGENGDPDFDDLIVKLEGLPYYDVLFSTAFGSSNISEERIQLALAQFIRSIQSFDSKYDEGRSLANNNNQAFQNFSELENRGKQLFMQGPQFQGNSGNRIGGGFGCQGCHEAPEFGIDDDSDNNGVIGVANDPTASDFDVTRSPSLRDMFDVSGVLHGGLMHTGDFDINMVLDHYNDIEAMGNPNLDNFLRRGGGINLNMTLEEKQAVVAFLRTLTGSDMYTNEKWSNPFVD